MTVKAVGLGIFLAFVFGTANAYLGMRAGQTVAATLDDSAVPIERWKHAFQSILVPAGEHRINFTFRSRGLRVGAMITMASLLALVLTMWRTHS